MKPLEVSGIVLQGEGPLRVFSRRLQRLPFAGTSTLADRFRFKVLSDSCDGGGESRNSTGLLPAVTQGVRVPGSWPGKPRCKSYPEDSRPLLSSPTRTWRAFR